MLRRSGKHVVGGLAVASLMHFCIIAWAQEAAPPAKRAAVPAVEAQNDARKLLGNLFRADYEQAKKPDEKAALAEKMLQVGSETRDDPNGQYMLFQIAKEIAIGTPSADMALRAVDAQGAIFEIDVPDAKLTTVTAIEKNLKFSKDRQALQGTLDQLVNEFLQAERYDLAKQGVTLSIDLARKIPDPAAIKQATTRLMEIDTREKRFSEVQAARKTLETKPDDPAANLTLGRFLCLVSGDWEQGLPLLAKGSDAKLKAMAQSELTPPEEPEIQMVLADAWWDLSEQETGTVQKALQRRALAWYQTALPQLSGLAKLKVIGRIEKASAKPDEASSTASAGPSRSTGSAARPTQKLMTNNLGMKLVLIPSGTFMMGSPPEEAGRRGNETQHRVTLTKPFYIGTTEVAQGQWTAVMGTQPWQGQPKVQEGANYPASYVSWQDANEFCRKLSEKEKKKYRLPTEAEWEHACRSGTKTPHNVSASVKFEDCAWYLSNAAVGKQSFPHEVGQKVPNSAGLYDMHGNVAEWCLDFMALYPETDVVDPQGSGSGTTYILRGGRCDASAAGCRSARRVSAPADSATYGDGFRVVCEP